MAAEERAWIAVVFIAVQATMAQTAQDFEVGADRFMLACRLLLMLALQSVDVAWLDTAPFL